MKREKIRVLHILERFTTGGAEKLLLDILVNQDMETFDPAVLSVFPRKNELIFEKKLENLKVNVKVFYLDKEYSGFGLISMQYKMSKIIRKFKPDIIHTHLSGIMYGILPIITYRAPLKLHTVHVDALLEANIMGIKMNAVSPGLYKIFKILPGKISRRIKNINDLDKKYQGICYSDQFQVYKDFDLQDFLEKAVVGSRLLKIAYKRFKFIPVAISDSVKNSLKDLYHLKDIPRIHNGIDVSVMTGAKKNPLKAVGKEIKIGHIGRFDFSKNHELLIDAFSILSRNFPGVRLMFIGDGPYRLGIMRKAALNNLIKNMEFLGERDDIPGLLSRCDIFVLSSIAEGFGLVLVEAMAAGVPVVATDVGGINEIVRDGFNGLLVEPNKPHLLAEALGKLARDKKLREQMGLKGIETAKKSDISSTVREYSQLYCRVKKK